MTLFTAQVYASCTFPILFIFLPVITANLCSQSLFRDFIIAGYFLLIICIRHYFALLAATSRPLVVSLPRFRLLLMSFSNYQG